MSIFIESRLDEVEKISAAATPGPWVALGEDIAQVLPQPYENPELGAKLGEASESDATFIAMARTTVPELVIALRSALAFKESFTEDKLAAALASAPRPEFDSVTGEMAQESSVLMAQSILKALTL